MSSAKKPDDEQERLSKLKSLSILNSAPEERFDRLTRMAKRLFNVEIAVVSFVDADRQWFKSKACYLELANETHRDISFCSHAILENGLFIVEDTHLDERFKDNPLVLGNPNIRFYAGYPIRMGGGSALGTLCIFDDKPREFGEEDQALLRDLGLMAEQQLNTLELATTDELTTLSNKRGFLTLAKHVLKVARREQLPISLIVIDLDGFKSINDKYGHVEGDWALKMFSKAMKDAFRDSDVLARLGGDEFALLISNSSDEVANTAIARLRGAVFLLNDESQRGYEIDFSAGIYTTLVDDSTTVESLIDAADRRMYLSKTTPTD